MKRFYYHATILLPTTYRFYWHEAILLLGNDFTALPHVTTLLLRNGVTTTKQFYYHVTVFLARNDYTTA